MTVYVRCIYNRAAHKGGHGHAWSYWSEYTVKTVLMISDYLVEKPVILIFQNFAEIA